MNVINKRLGYFDAGGDVCDRMGVSILSAWCLSAAASRLSGHKIY